MKIAMFCGWMSPGEKTVGGVNVIVTKNRTDADYIADVQEYFSPLSGKYPREKRVFVHTEPEGATNYSPDLADRLSSYYGALILSWHSPLARFKQTRPYTMGGCWTKGPLGGRKFGVGGFFSGKSGNFDGYALRHDILRRENEIKIPSMVYNFRGHWQGKPHKYPVDSKIEGMQYAFHLAIESRREQNYISEKLIDCFANTSVPLYFGDPNVGSVFNPAGIVVLDQTRYMDQINSLTKEDYSSRAGAIRDNFERSKPFWSLEDNIAAAIVRGLGA